MLDAHRKKLISSTHMCPSCLRHRWWSAWQCAEGRGVLNEQIITFPASLRGIVKRTHRGEWCVAQQVVSVFFVTVLERYRGT